MIAILKGGLNPKQLAAVSPAQALDAGVAIWILGRNLDDAIRQAEGLGESLLIGELERLREARPGRYRVLDDYLVLISGAGG